MSEYITIISKEAITRGIAWPTLIIAAISLLVVIIGGFISLKIDDDLKIFFISFYISIIGVLLTIACGWVCDAFFPVETGRYKYSGTIDENTPIVEFIEFKESYDNVECKDGIWYWEDKQ